MESPSSLPDRTPASPPAPEAPLLARLPARSRAELLHLRMQDHYVEVHTTAGSEMLLLRFRDALREVEGIDGLQVHRSHWVARAAVVGVERQRGGRIALRLVNGAKVPVSRSFAPPSRLGAGSDRQADLVVDESGSGRRSLSRSNASLATIYRDAHRVPWAPDGQAVTARDAPG